MKVRNFLRPYGPIRDRLLGQWARWQLRNIDLPRGDSAELKPHFIDLALLHHAILKRGPSVVLEFGIGFSTIVMADACKTIGGSLYTVDANEDWVANTRSKLKDPVNLVHSPVKAGDDSHRYVSPPDIVPDMIYLDGPSPKDVPGWEGSPISADVLDYKPKLEPGCLLVIDGRYTNVDYLKANVARQWDFRTDERLRRTEAVLVA